MNLSEIPMSQPPPGQVTNFVDPVSISWAGRLSIWLTLPIMAVAFVLRIYVRLKSRQMGIDDYFLVVGAVGAASFCGTLIPIFLKDVWGRHAWDIPVSSIVPWFFKFSVTAGCLYNISAMFTKVSILAFYLRIFSPARSARALIWCGIIFIVLGYMTLTIAMLAWMVPHRGDGGWGSTANTERMNVASRQLDFTQGIFSVVSDFYVITIPTGIIYRLNMKTQKKIGVACIFLFGFVSLGCSIAGTVLRYHAMVFTVVDNRWLSVKFEALCVVELNIGVLCACVPVFFVVLRTWKQRTETGFAYLKQRLLTSPGSKETVVLGERQQKPGVSLDIPTGTLSGLKTFFHKLKPDQETVKSGIRVSHYFELQSVDIDYHAHIRGDAASGRNPSLAGSKGVSRGASRGGV
ncbi:hypothetical protein CBS63078_3261 [Aspergillus niger]|nr:hypothetical protein CBS115989_1167 [Aspergillus niger]KAI2839034.1 hypothetical protein CBS11350_7738 [Aspergillus niger]KAI2858599.1 hypothetical protein CBS11232_2365 [Aspergillus niger]KAI2866341.1 hypothetical protein CBS12448_1449 [Aspergillus niger]KAI2879682.1 hypothetical protein CBS115988_2218 [Aspergillus niger]